MTSYDSMKGDMDLLWSTFGFTLAVPRKTNIYNATCATDSARRTAAVLEDGTVPTPLAQGQKSVTLGQTAAERPDGATVKTIVSP